MIEFFQNIMHFLFVQPGEFLYLAYVYPASIIDIGLSHIFPSLMGEDGISNFALSPVIALHQWTSRLGPVRGEMAIIMFKCILSILFYFLLFKIIQNILRKN